MYTLWYETFTVETTAENTNKYATSCKMLSGLYSASIPQVDATIRSATINNIV